MRFQTKRQNSTPNLTQKDIIPNVSFIFASTQLPRPQAVWQREKLIGVLNAATVAGPVVSRVSHSGERWRYICNFAPALEGAGGQSGIRRPYAASSFSSRCYENLAGPSARRGAGNHLAAQRKCEQRTENTANTESGSPHLGAPSPFPSYLQEGTRKGGNST